MSSFYQILGISEDASQLEVKLAYRKLAKRYHPDVNAGAKGAEEQFKGIVEAYSTLSDFTARKDYDAKLMGSNRLLQSLLFILVSKEAQEEKSILKKI